MKHIWAVDYVWRGRGGHEVQEWLAAKRRELENATGVRWSCSEAHGEYIFRPYLDKGTPTFGEALRRRVLEAIEATGADKVTRMTDFIRVAEYANLELPIVLAVAKELVTGGLCNLDVDRQGKAVYIKKRQ